MKAICLFLLPALVMAASCGTSPVNSDPEDHQEVVDKSRRERTVVISLDTIFNAGVPYAVILGAPEVLPGRARGVGANIYTLSGSRVLRTVPVNLYGDHYVSYRFDDGRYRDTAWIGYHESMLEDARTIVRADLLSRDSINQTQAREFVARYPRPPYRAPRRGEMVTRDRSQAITIDRGEIWQTGVRIGRYDSTGFALSGISFAQITIDYVDSVHCATITHGIAPADTSSAVVTARDGKPHVVTRESNRTLFESVVWFLVRQSYL